MNSIAERNNKVDRFEQFIVNELPPAKIDLVHLFADGMYARVMSAEKDAVMTSKIHNTQHFFVLTQGSLVILDDNDNATVFYAPHIGVTEPGTRRRAIALEDMTWVTFHANPNNENEIEIEERIIEKHENKLLYIPKSEIK